MNTSLRPFFTLCYAALVLSGMPGAGCRDPRRALDETRQFKTYFRMEELQGKLNKAAAEHQGVLPESQARRIISNSGDGRDEWGQAFIYTRVSVRREFETLLISSGSDRALDSKSMLHYVEMNDTNITGDPSRDIVFRNGAPITRVGK